MAHDVASMLTAEDLEIKMREVRSKLNRYLRGDASQLDDIPELRKSTERLLASARASARAEGELDYISKVEQGCHEFFAVVERARQSGSPNEQIAQFLWDSRMEHDIFEPSREYIDYHRQIVARTSDQSQMMADRMGLGLLLLGICGSAAGLLAGFGIARGINRFIVQLSVPVHGAAGKLNEVVGPITLSATASFEELESALQDMADHIGTVVERLEQREREVLRSEQLAAVGQLAAGVAHELRNPLMAIKILVQSAGERGDGGLRGRDLAVVEEEIGRLETSIQSLLDFARPPRPEKVALDLGHLIRQTFELVSARAEQQHVSLVSHLPEIPAMVEADGGQIRQVLLNLLLNALDALPEGGVVKIDVVGWRRAAAGGVDPEQAAVTGAAGVQRPLLGPSRWEAFTNGPDAMAADRAEHGFVIKITDNGCGLPADLGNRIFEPFVSTKETGTGLGLPICRRIVEDHGGVIDAGNIPAGGAEFDIWLPRAGERDFAESADATVVSSHSVDALGPQHAALARNR
ncbi:MAG TPA: ATP-binding protein [Pirellulales bacterium]|nr:ATP-binding protein [Pirellulales bacterium]